MHFFGVLIKELQNAGCNDKDHVNIFMYRVGLNEHSKKIPLHIVNTKICLMTVLWCFQICNNSVLHNCVWYAQPVLYGFKLRTYMHIVWNYHFPICICDILLFTRCFITSTLFIILFSTCTYLPTVRHTLT